MPHQYSPEFLRRFNRRIDRSGTCWIWTGAKRAEGYGKINFNRVELRTHRVAYEIAHGAIPEGLHVCHHCDNPSCVRPDHLFVGTSADNTRDRVSKGRSSAPHNPAMGARNGHYTKPSQTPRGERSGRYTKPESTARGNRHGRSKLTEEAVADIRASNATNEELAALYGVHHETVRRVRKGEWWKHVA